MLLNILKAFLIGICASAPLGPTAIFILQVSLGKGHRTGFLTGLGATTVDTLYSAVAVFALAAVSGFIDSHEVLILIAGGLVVALVGVSVVFKDPFRRLEPGRDTDHPLKDYLQAVALALSNPASVFVMLTLFAFFGVDVSGHDMRVAPVIMAVAAGSASYWFMFSSVFGRIRKHVKLGVLVWLNRIAGVAIAIIGISLFAEGCIKLFF
jgi:threonine/homoserine/homoserine lactone efflux protein